MAVVVHGACDVCGVDGVVLINSVPYCLDHLDVGFDGAFRTMALMRGVSPSLVDGVVERGRAMLDELVERMNDGAP